MICGYFHRNDPELFERYKFSAQTYEYLGMYRQLADNGVFDIVSAGFDYADMEKSGPTKAFGAYDTASLKQDFAEFQPLPGGFVLIFDASDVPEKVNVPPPFLEKYPQNVKGLFAATNPKHARFAIYERCSAAFDRTLYLAGIQKQPVSVYKPTVSVRVVDLVGNKEIFSGSLTAVMRDEYMLPGNVGEHYAPFGNVDFDAVFKALRLAMSKK